MVYKSDKNDAISLCTSSPLLSLLVASSSSSNVLCVKGVSGRLSLAAKVLRPLVLYTPRIPPSALGDFVRVIKKADMGVLTPNADLPKILVVDELSCNVVPKVEVAGFAVVKTSVVDPNAEGVNLR